MQKETQQSGLSEFEKEVQTGLTAYPKFLSSKFFYDQKGDKLFQDITELPEYYLTRCEAEILQNNTQAISEVFDGSDGFDLFELGAGDGKKTKTLLRHFLDRQLDFKYFPIDISQNVLNELEAALKNEFPQLSVHYIQGLYAQSLQKIASYTGRKKVIMMIGSNIGNLKHSEAVDFLVNIQKAMGPNDLLFMGFDQKKDPAVILNAYHDSTGVTEAFNKNILHRINTQLGANFDLDHFQYWPTYDPETGTVKSFLVSKMAQSVNIEALDMTVHFDEWESIHTEISQKYDDSVVEWLAKEAGLKVHSQFSDGKNYYKNYVFRKLL